jgi:general L-amino acid transport system permease protein
MASAPTRATRLGWRGTLIVLALALAVAGLWHEAAANLARRNVASGFAFLHQQAGFDIGESEIAYQASDSYARALFVGILNTLKVSLIGIVLATLAGTLLGLALLSSNWLLSKLALLYVSLFRNTPLFLQLFVWYGIFSAAPGPRAAWSPLPGTYLSNRGLTLPWPVLLPSPHLSWPALTGFNFTGGVTLTPEFAALLAGLVFYTGAYIGEILRAGILAVPRSQSEAAIALGLRPWPALRLVILPQALRLMLPPLTSQYLNLLKNSSLAIAIGYPDLVAIVNTEINQTGQAIEGVLLIMAVYLVASLAISGVSRRFGARGGTLEAIS